MKAKPVTSKKRARRIAQELAVQARKITTIPLIEVPRSHKAAILLLCKRLMPQRKGSGPGITSYYKCLVCGEAHKSPQLFKHAADCPLGNLITWVNLHAAKRDK